MSSVLLGAAPVAASDAPFVAVCFSVQAAAEPGVMPRVLELFAKRGLVPQKWQSAVSGTVLTIDVQVGRLRRKLEDDPQNPTLIKTVRGSGYIFTPAVDLN